MSLDPRTPVLVGVGQVTERPDPDRSLTERDEPASLMERALAAAADDCGAGRGLLERTGSLRVVQPISWRYANAGALVAQRLGIEPAEIAQGPIGGNTPLVIAGGAAQDIAAGRVDVVAVVGGECLYTRVAAQRDPDRPLLSWTTQPADTAEPVALGTDRSPVTDLELERGLTRPTAVYPLFENALRAAAGETIDEHQVKVSRLWARFSEVAASNPYAWSRDLRSAEEIRTPTADNRMVAFPYPKLMNANDRVDQAAGFLMCSLEAARSAGVPEDNMVFLLAGADATDHWYLTHRDRLDASPAIARCGARALEGAGLTIDDVGHVDLYSCFPCAVQIGANELGLAVDDPARPLTVTGGLGFAGGPINNYGSHALATMARRLRADPGSVGLTTGVGWYLTKHVVALWSTSPPAAGVRWESPQEEIDALAQRSPAGAFEGECVVETYSVVCGRDGQPQSATLALLTDDGSRTWGTVSDSGMLDSLVSEEGCGRKARLRSDGRAELP